MGGCVRKSKGMAVTPNKVKNQTGKLLTNESTTVKGNRKLTHRRENVSTETGTNT